MVGKSEKRKEILKERRIGKCRKRNFRSCHGEQDVTHLEIINKATSKLVLCHFSHKKINNNNYYNYCYLIIVDTFEALGSKNVSKGLSQEGMPQREDPSSSTKMIPEKKINTHVTFTKAEFSLHLILR